MTIHRFQEKIVDGGDISIPQTATKEKEYIIKYCLPNSHLVPTVLSEGRFGVTFLTANVHILKVCNVNRIPTHVPLKRPSNLRRLQFCHFFISYTLPLWTTPLSKSLKTKQMPAKMVNCWTTSSSSGLGLTLTFNLLQATSWMVCVEIDVLRHLSFLIVFRNMVRTCACDFVAKFLWLIHTGVSSPRTGYNYLH